VSEVDFLVKLRDAACIIKDACEARLDDLAPKGVKSFSEPCDLIPSMEGVMFKPTVGPSGAYEKAEPDPSNPAYSLLLKALGEHHGKMTADGYFVWVFVDQSIGRKKKESL